MKKLMVSVFALTMMATGAMAGERLTTSQLDEVTAGFLDQTNVAVIEQFAFASARASNVCVLAICKQRNKGATAVASNSAVVGQANVR